MVPVIKICTDPDITDSASNFDLIVVLIELVNVFNEPVLVSIESTRFFKFKVVVAALELNPSVVVATEEDKLPIELENEELNPLVVVATLELKESILDDKPLVVVATELDNEPILVDTLELNVEYPVVPVIKT